jgi:hypothetical protein
MQNAKCKIQNTGHFADFSVIFLFRPGTGLPGIAGRIQ